MLMQLHCVLRPATAIVNTASNNLRLFKCQPLSILTIIWFTILLSKARSKKPLALAYIFKKLKSGIDVRDAIMIMNLKSRHLSEQGKKIA